MNISNSKILLSALIACTFATGTFAQAVKKTPPKAKPAPVIVTRKVVVPPQNQNNQNNSKKMSEIDSVSYAIGVNIAQSFKAQGLTNINPEQIKNGIKDMLAGNPTVNEQMCGQIIQSFMTKQMAEKGKGAKLIGEKFLAENKAKAGVITTASGLQYSVLKEGTGVKPTTASSVKVHYHGTTIDGNVFDSSVNRGQPAEFGVTQVIAGWTEALQLMSVGSKYKLVIPSNLAYGERGAGGDIGPNSTLIFEVELLEITK